MYATVSELAKRLGDLYGSLYVDSDGTAMTDEAEADLAAASAEINGALARRYAVPVTADAAAPLLRSWCQTLAEELAWARSGKDALPQNLKDRVSSVRASLERAANGSLLLPGAAPAATGAATLVDAGSDEPVFTRDKMRGF